jgi:hypothetical protein
MEGSPAEFIGKVFYRAGWTAARPGIAKAASAENGAAGRGRRPAMILFYADFLCLHEEKGFFNPDSRRMASGFRETPGWAGEIRRLCSDRREGVGNLQGKYRFVRKGNRTGFPVEKTFLAVKML